MSDVHFTSTPVALKRLCLTKLANIQIGNNHTVYICSGHGSSIEFYSAIYNEAISFKTQRWNFHKIFDAFPDRKPSVHGLYTFGQVENEFWIVCVAEDECALFSLNLYDDGKFDWKKEHGWHFNGWIINVKPLGYRDKKMKMIVLHSATNCIKLMHLSRIDDEYRADAALSVQLDCRALITASFLQGDSWESLLVFAGTNLGSIHLFQPAKGSHILRTFAGNKGMPFAIRCSANWLFSVADDRSLRVWDSQSGKQLFDKYGHSARPFVLELYDLGKIAFTGGADDYICVWRWKINSKNSPTDKEMMDLLILERKIDLFAGALDAIRSILVLERDKTKEIELLVGSERGALACLSLSSPTNAGNLFPYKINAFVFAMFDHVSLLIFLDENRSLIVQRINSDTLLGMNNLDQQININFVDSHGDPMTFRPDLFVYSNFTKALALCSESDLHLHLILFRISPNYSISYHVLHLEGPFEQIHWVQPEFSQLLLTVNTHGSLIIYRVDYENDSKDSRLSPILLQKTDAKLSKVQCNLLIGSEEDASSGVLLLGTRSGSFVAYSIPSGRCLLEYQNAHVSVGKRISHMRCGVTALRLEKMLKSNEMRAEGILMSTGKDGKLKRWHFRSEQIEKNQNVNFSLELLSMCHLPVEWPCAFVSIQRNNNLVESSDMLLAGFHSDAFLLMDTKNNCILSTFRCGGGNRSWQLIIDKEGQKFSLAYVHKGLLNYTALSLTKVHLIQDSIHSENIVALASLGQFIFPKNTPKSKLTGELILSGGLDRRLSIFFMRTDSTPSTIFPIDSAQIHCASIEGMCVIDARKWDQTFVDDQKIIVSVGGRSELCVWRLRCFIEATSPQLHFLSSFQLADHCSSDDTRLMAVRHLVGQLFAILCSDGSIRLIRLPYPPPLLPLPNSSPAQCIIRIPSLAMFRSLSIVNNFLFALSSDGNLYSFRILADLLQQSDDISHSNSFCRELSPPFPIERCGLSSLTIVELDQLYILFVGSESGRISVLKCHCPVTDDIAGSVRVELSATGDWHSSTITALQTHLPPPLGSPPILVFSTSLDCLLCVGSFHRLNNLLIAFRQFPLGVSDPAAMLLIPPHYDDPSASSTGHDTTKHQKFNFLISGAGIQQIHLDFKCSEKDNALRIPF